MLRCLVIDDEPLALQILADYIQQTKGLVLIDTTTNPLKGLERVQRKEVDVVFLDIQMPELTGIEFMQKTEGLCQVILVTAYPEFAIDGYEYNAIDYLLKPVSFERFTRAVQKLPLAAKPGETVKPDHIFVKSEYKLLRVELNAVLYFESLRDYTAIHLTNGNKILTLQSLSSFEKELPGSQFVRIHKSYIIALNKIDFIEKNRVIIKNNYLPVGDTYKSNFQKRISYS